MRLWQRFNTIIDLNLKTENHLKCWKFPNLCKCYSDFVYVWLDICFPCSRFSWLNLCGDFQVPYIRLDEVRKIERDKWQSDGDFF